METVTDFIFLGSKITAVGGCSYNIQKHLLLGRKAITNLDSVLKIREITFPTSQYFASGGQRIVISASTSVLPMHIED